ncbi:MAG TPA: hypothetical protein DCL49_13125 [Candidatus Omnitrophica bacterium]|nr:hypothetical protein [Candidatus Omnitrophota bacterium]
MKLLLLDRPLLENIVRKREVEFFGPWAEPIHSPVDLSEPSFEPYPDPQSVYEMSVAVMRRADNILTILSDIMPALTGVSAGARFWRMYLGFHVTMLAGIVEDILHRRACLPEKDYILGLPIEKESNSPAPYSWREAWHRLQFQDDFKWLVMSVCLRDYYRNREPVAYQKIPLRRITKKSEEFYAKFFQIGYKRIIRKASSLLPYHFGIPGRLSQRHISESSLVCDRYQMEDFDFNKLGAVFFSEKYFTQGMSISSNYQDKKKRAQLRESLPKPYGELFSGTLPLFDLEGLARVVKAIKDSGLRAYKSIKRVYTHGQAFSDDGARRVCFALLADEGKEIIAIQHGIGHAYFAHSGLFPERVIADEHIYWGNGYLRGVDSAETLKARVLPSIYLSRLKQWSSHPAHSGKRKKWDVLFVVLEENRYIKWLYSPLFPDLARDYFKRQNKLFDYFLQGRNAAVKVYPVTYGWGQFSWIKSHYPRARILTTGKFVKCALNARIVITDYLGTSFIEMLAMGIPFLASWNRRWFCGIKYFEEAVDRLIEAGIFYEDPGVLIKSYTEDIAPDILSWWNDKRRQDVIRAIADEFAMISPQAQQQWQSEFLRQPKIGIS